ncbi:hypothetical protein CC78DRAFT_512106 [Lojkania enalia]|uniref:peptidylprolyl isomerase n=1 Tax=Lojkania enalia TaxID=147567 RepID=A0A9P4KEX0_9PLEO|nr:hypothetical protein CC78DRAFT_512106 [Didymosphaeria enalia]
MAGLLPASVYGLRVPAAGILIPAFQGGFPGTIRITMAAIDPDAEPQLDEDRETPRATLKLIRTPLGRLDDEDDSDYEDDDEDDIEAIKARLAGVISDDDEDMSEDEDDSENEKNGGPSDPAKAKQAKRAALTKKLQKELEAEEIELDTLTNGVNGTKGKARASDDGISSDEEEEDEEEEFVICTLDPEKNYQQPLDITIGEDEEVGFVVSGTHDIFLTGNYVLPPGPLGDDEDDEDEDDEMLYDLSPDEEELGDMSDEEDDELDGLQNPRITEVDTDEDEAPKLIATDKAKKGKNKRPAESEEDEATTLDDLISKAKKEAPATNGEQKLSKKQAKKLKNNEGQAVVAAQEPAKKEAPSSDKKKVQFAKNLELGPTGSPKVDEKKEVEKKEGEKKEGPTAKTGPRIVNGVTVDDKKIGKGRAAKKGDRIEMRYIGKLKNGRQFDANKKGKPFAFKLGAGEVIKGWDIGVTGICAGGERRLTIPAKLAYGNKALPDIPANSDLIFDIKCISVS